MFVLASASPRRKRLLEEYGFKFTVRPSVAEEKNDFSLPPQDLVVRLARAKANDVYKIEKMPTLGADTIVVFDGKILGKPADRSENESFLRKLSGKTHQVYTGFCLITEDKTYSGYDVSNVRFRSLSDDEIAAYVKSGKGLDKAGGYGIQDGEGLVDSIDGSYTCVVGLPMEVVGALINEVLVNKRTR